MQHARVVFGPYNIHWILSEKIVKILGVHKPGFGGAFLRGRIHSKMPVGLHDLVSYSVTPAHMRAEALLEAVFNHGTAKRESLYAKAASTKSHETEHAHSAHFALPSERGAHHYLKGELISSLAGGRTRFNTKFYVDSILDYELKRYKMWLARDEAAYSSLTRLKAPASQIENAEMLIRKNKERISRFERTREQRFNELSDLCEQNFLAVEDAVGVIPMQRLANLLGLISFQNIWKRLPEIVELYKERQTPKA